MKVLLLLLISPVLMIVSALVLALTDAAWLVFGRRQAPRDTLPSASAASVVIPNWNGRDLLEKYLPSVAAALAGNAANEIIVVDNGSTDGSVEFLRQNFPGVKTLALEKNLGFGGGSNTGIRAAANDIVILLNSDMRVDAGFLAPLLAGFTDEKVFAVSCQIFLSDPAKRREETGLTEGRWRRGALRVGHRADEAVNEAFPCFYGGGGSCAFDRKKLLELGGFDPLYEPFYLEDTDLGYLAWKRGWKVLYQPASIVYHEHRGTIGKKFRADEIASVLKKNFVLFAWKNIHESGRIAEHLVFAYANALASVFFSGEPQLPNLTAIWRAFCALPRAAGSRWRARSLAVVTDTEAFLRPQGGYFRDRFAKIDPDPRRLRVLFVSPYPICPPVHGGGMLMYGTLRELTHLAEVHALVTLDRPEQLEANLELRTFCASAEFLVRHGSARRLITEIAPQGVREFAIAELEWLIHRQLYLKRIDVLQLEYSPLAQYAARFQQMACVLFEHDIHFQALARGREHFARASDRAYLAYEYLRVLRYELRTLPHCDRVQVCTADNREYLGGFLPEMRARIQSGLRAGIDTSRYSFHADGREPGVMLFVGSFRHQPNQVALEWFVREILPRITAQRPQARLRVVGSDPPERSTLIESAAQVELVGFVDDIRAELARCAVFVCPIRSGSGVRVKLLEAFACGIPVVSTRVGAEGLTSVDGEYCALADDPEEFARKVLDILDRPEQAAAVARRARDQVIHHWDMAAITRKLEQSYREVLSEKRGAICRRASS
ncbi:MAG: glycosyltransferase [Candidatus Solibacter usitatus]|nr:glycosyltransferase [Candidatus Solibacter usitatus]